MGDKSFQIKITQELIDTAEQCSSRNCIIAMAVREQHGAWSIAVDASTIRFNTGKKGTVSARRHYCATPAAAALKLKAWETDRTSVKPFHLVLSKDMVISDSVQRRPKATRPYKARDPEWYEKHRPKRCVRRYAGLRGIHLDGKAS